MHRDSTAVEFLVAGTPWKCAPHDFVTYDETGIMFYKACVETWKW
jgi:hypothetical protein